MPKDLQKGHISTLRTFLPVAVFHVKDGCMTIVCRSPFTTLPQELCGILRLNLAM